MKIKTTNDVIALNKTNKPIGITGIARCGTTFMNRQIYRQAVINNPTQPIGFVDEFMRIRTGIYEFYFDELPRLKPFKDTDAWAGYFFHQSYGFPGSTQAYDKGAEARKALLILEPRVRMLKEYDLSNVHMKVFPMDMVTAYICDQEFGHKVLDSYNWLFLYRKDWLEAYKSFVWGALHDKFHFYHEEELHDTDTWNHGGMKVKKAWANPFLAKMTIEQTYGEIHSIFSDQVDWTLLEMSQISGIEKNEDEFYELVKGGYEYKKYIPDDYWMRNPKVFEDKKKFVQDNLVHVEKLEKKAIKRMKEICHESKGLLNLSEDGLELFIDETKRRKGEPNLRAEKFAESFTIV